MYPPCGPSQDGEEPGSTLPTLEKADTLGRGEGSLHYLPVLEASLGTTPPSASKLPFPTLPVLTDVVEVAPCSQQDVVACKNGLHMLAASENNPVLISIV